MLTYTDCCTLLGHVYKFLYELILLYYFCKSLYYFYCTASDLNIWVALDSCLYQSHKGEAEKTSYYVAG